MARLATVNLELPYRRIETMNNSGWQRARRECDSGGLAGLHVHDLRHTVGMRLREAGVPESTTADILWHSNPTMTRHYSVAQVVELHAALEKIKEDRRRWNKSLAMLRREQEDAARLARKGLGDSPGDRSPPAKKNGLETEISKPLI